MSNYNEIVRNWRANWKTKSKYLSIKGCTTIDEVLEIAVKKAHSPSVARALKLDGLKTIKPRKEAEEYLINEIKDKINKTLSELEYDLWVEKICERIRTIYRNYNILDYTYGNAQKLFNMTIKYIFSSDNVDPHLPIFKVAHIPIDGIIMKIINKKLNVRKMPKAWSKTDEYKDIKDYQIEYRNALPENYTPLLWECENWENN